MGIIESRKIIAWYIKGIKNATKLRKKSFEVSSIEDVLLLIESIKQDVCLE